MKNYLLDTHVLLWWLSGENKIHKKALAIISNVDNLIFVSAATIWEISIKKSLGKLRVSDNIKDAIESSSFQYLSVTAEHAFCVERLSRIHNDPFDRLLIAQCIVDDLTFITADKIVAKYGIECIKV